jgi:hypothetical protein
MEHPDTQALFGTQAMDHVVKLDQLPQGLEFPPDLKERCFLDATKKQLVFRGFMSSADYGRLFRLHTDVEYHKALAQLFQLSSEEQAPQMALLRKGLGFLVVLTLVLAGLVWWQLLRDLP